MHHIKSNAENRISIIIGFTPYHAYFSGNIIENLEGKIYCVFSKKWPNTTRHYDKVGLSNSRFNTLGLITSLFHLSLIAREISRKNLAVDIYIPHPGNIFSNYLFHTNTLKKRLFLYEDGLLNYIETKTTKSFISPAKRAIACLAGLPYKDYTGHTAGYDVRPYDGAFLTMPDKAVQKDRLGEVKIIKIKATPISSTPNTILFLDQDVSGYLSATERIRSIERMLQIYPPGIFKYFYKPHHDFKSHLANSMTPISADLLTCPAEELVEVIKPSHIVSFFSSALLNIKNTHPECHCISLAADKIIVNRGGRATPLSNLFEQLGVKTL